MRDAGKVKRRVWQALTALVTAVGVAFTGGLSAHAALYDPVPNQGVTSGGTETSMVVGQTLTQVSTGSTHSLGVSSDGNLYSWGGNFYGQLGDGTKTGRLAPGLVSRGEIPVGVTIDHLEAGIFYSVAAASDGNLYAWGRNSEGQLGDGTRTDRSTPVLVTRGAIPAGVTIEQLATGYYHSVALASDGNMYSWGQNTSGGLGDGSTTDRLNPVLVSRGAIPAGVTITQIATGADYSVVLGSNGKLYSWGANNFGQLGYSANSQLTPRLVSSGVIPAGVAIEQVASGFFHSVVLGADGNMYAWGQNTQGQLGDGSTTERFTPVLVSRGAIPAGVTIAQVDTGFYHSMMLGSDGNVYTWGQNAQGQLGDGSKTDRSVPVAVLRGEMPAGVTTELIATGLYHSVVLGSDGNTYAWGDNSNGQLGTGAQTSRPTPGVVSRGQLPDKIVTMTQVAEGTQHAVGIASDGNLYAWGMNTSGQVGDGTTTNRSTPVRVSRGAIPAGVTFVQVAAGGFHSVVLGSDGNLYAWGSNIFGQVGDDTTTNRSTPVLVSRGAIPAGLTFTQVTAGSHHSILLGADGNMYSWGYNAYGELGDGTTTDRATPVLVSRGVIPAGVSITQLATGNTHAVVLGSDGNLYAWGNNSYGDVGDGTKKNRSSPVLVLPGAIPAEVSIEQVIAGNQFSVVSGSDGNMYSWGQNTYGQVGDGTTTDRDTPVLVLRGAIPAGVTFTQITASGYHAVLLGSDGNMYSWGYNSQGQLGDDTWTPRSAPVLVLRGAIPAGVTFTEVTAGGYHSAALGSDGNRYAWGDDYYGQLGDGATTPRFTPVLTKFTEMITGVVFGGSTASAVSQNTNGAITAVTYVHAAGTVDVEVRWSLNGVDQPEMVRPQSFTYVAPPVFWFEPVNQVVAGGSSAEFTVETNTPATIIWEVSPDQGATWAPVIPSADEMVSDDGLTLTALGDEYTNGHQYRAIASNAVASVTSAEATLTVVFEPGFVTNPADQRVAVGQDAVFTVATDVPADVLWESSPNATGPWTLLFPGAGVTLSPDRLTLTVTGTPANDGSRYRAIASNIAGEVRSAAADLTVIEAPEVTNPADQGVGSGSTAAFVVTEQRADTLTWQFTDDAGASWSPVVLGGGVTVSADGHELYVVATPANDGHQYRAVASNIAGTATSKAATLTLVPLPGFLTNPADQTVADGQDAVFTVLPDAVSTVSWETSADGGASWIPVESAAGVTLSADGLELTVTGTVLNDGHWYRAIAEDAGGTSRSESATLTVIQAPVIVTDPVDQAVPSGATAGFVVTEERADTVVWQVSADEGVSWSPVVEGDGVTVSDRGRTLQVVGTSANTGYQYVAVASNMAGTVNSDAATLTVTDEPIFVTDPLDQEVVLGDPAVFTVATDIPATVTWQVSVDNRVSWAPLAPGTDATVSADERTLTVTGALDADLNYYRAVATNTAGVALSGSAQLRVITEPVIITNPDDQTVATGTDAVFTVAASTPSSVTWQVSSDGGAVWEPISVDPAAVPSADGLTLTVTGSAANTGFQYRAVASNIAGAVNSSAATLTVVEAPVILTNPTDQTVIAGELADFTVTVAGEVLVSWEMSLDGGVTWVPAELGAIPIPGSDDYTLEMTGTAENDGHQYRAVASNIAGETTSDGATLIVISAPVFITNPADQTIPLGGQAVFTAATDLGLPITWQVSENYGVSWNAVSADANTVVSADGFTLTVTGTDVNTGHQYCAVASNAAGTVNSSAALLTVIGAPVFITNPVDQKVAAGDTAVFEVETSPVVPVSWQVSPDAGATWTAVVPGDGVTLTSGGLVLQIMGTDANTGYQYRAVASNASGTVTSAVATLTVESGGGSGAETGADAGVDPDGDADAGGSDTGAGADTSGSNAGAGAGAGAAGAGASADGNHTTNPGGTLTNTGLGGNPTGFWVLVALMMSVTGAGMLIRRNRKRAEGDR